MATSTLEEVLPCGIQKVWELVTDVARYPQWRSDLSRTEILRSDQFVEYTKDGIATTFTVTAVEPNRRWEFDMVNEKMHGHWTGLFSQQGGQTRISFTEKVIADRFYMAPFVKAYLQKQQKQFILDLKKALQC